MGPLAAVPLDSWGSVLSVEERVLASEETVQLSNHLVVVVFEPSFNYDSELSLGLLQIHQEFEK